MRFASFRLAIVQAIAAQYDLLRLVFLPNRPTTLRARLHRS